MLSRIPTPSVSQPGTTSGSLVGGGVRKEVQADLESHTREPVEGGSPDEAAGRQKEEACPYLTGRTARVALS